MLTCGVELYKKYSAVISVCMDNYEKKQWLLSWIGVIVTITQGTQ